MGFEESFALNGKQIKTTVTNDPEKINDLLRSFLQPPLYCSDEKKKVVGLDAEWVLFRNLESRRNDTKCATLNLCDGNSCLIIQLQRLPYIPNSLLNFLRLPDYTFIGIGIKDNLAKLEKHYGIGCRNAVELGEFIAVAIPKSEMPCLRFCGVDDITRAVSQIDLRLHRPLSPVFKDWSQTNLSSEQARLATINVYSYYVTGSSLIP